MVARQAVREHIVCHAREDAPNECCGLLIGAGGRIERAVRARNAHSSRTRFLIAPEDHFAALRQARAETLDIVGAYHSHPASAPVPSETDLAESNDPTLVHLIVSLADDVEDIRAFRYADGNFQRLELVFVG